MRSLAPLMLILLLTSGCTSLGPKVTIADAAPPKTQYVIDKAGPDAYPPFLAAEANIYSCRYGIHYQGREQFSPPKEEIFASLLAKNAPWVTDHRVELERFDVYYNQRLKMLEAGGLAVGGIIGNAIAAAAQVNNGIFSNQGLIVYSNPASTPERPEENAVGCDGENEGEYYASQVSGGHDVVVTWVKFTVDDTPYQFKTLYQYQPPRMEDKHKGMATAIELSFSAIGRLMPAPGTQRVQQAAPAVVPASAAPAARAAPVPVTDSPVASRPSPQTDAAKTNAPASAAAAPAATTPTAPAGRWQTVGQRRQVAN